MCGNLFKILLQILKDSNMEMEKTRYIHKLDGCIYDCMYGWMDKWINSWLDEQLDGRTAGWMNSWMNSCLFKGTGHPPGLFPGFCLFFSASDV